VAVQKLLGIAVDVVVAVGERGERDLAGRRGEVGPAELDPDGVAGKPGAAEPAPDAFGQAAEGAFELGLIGDIAGKRGLVADRLHLVIRAHRAVIDAARAPDEVVAMFAEPGGQVGLGPVGEISNGMDAQ